MSKKSNPTMIGGFVVGAVVLIASGIALFGGKELFAERFHYVALFEEQTKGLRVGSNVLLNGVRIGYVSDIALLIDESEFTTLTRVTMEVLPDTYIPLRDGAPIGEDMQEVMSHDTLIREAGLRAQLEIESFVTGQLLVRLDFRPDVDFEAMAKGLTDSLNGVAALANSPDLHEILAGLNTIVNDEETQAVSASLLTAINDVAAAARVAKELMKTADGELDVLGDELAPVLSNLSDTLVSAEQTLMAVRLQLRGDSEQAYQLQSTMREVELAATALRDFFDLLERNPEALIRGKKK
jgi:paraquat-inducible protein B